MVLQDMKTRFRVRNSSRRLIADDLQKIRFKLQENDPAQLVKENVKLNNSVIRDEKSQVKAVKDNSSKCKQDNDKDEQDQIERKVEMLEETLSIYQNSVCSKKEPEKAVIVPKKKEKVTRYFRHSPEELNKNVQMLSQAIYRNATYKEYPQNKYIIDSIPYEEEKEAFRFKQLVAKAIVNKGYGLSQFEEYLKESKTLNSVQFIRCRDGHQYRAATMSVASKSYRKLQAFLINYSGSSLIELTRQQVQLLYPAILDSKKSFSGDEAETMNSFIKIVYGLQTVKICYLSSFKLYRELIELLKNHLNDRYRRHNRSVARQRIRKKSVDERERIGSIMQGMWGKEHELFLIQVMKKHSNLRNISVLFKQKFPVVAFIFNDKNLATKQWQLIRSAIRQIVFSFVRLKQIVPKIEIDRQKIKAISQLVRYYSLRKRLLINYPGLVSQNIEQLKELVDEINSIDLKSERERQLIEVEELKEEITGLNWKEEEDGNDQYYCKDSQGKQEQSETISACLGPFQSYFQ